MIFALLPAISIGPFKTLGFLASTSKRITSAEPDNKFSFPFMIPANVVSVSLSLLLTTNPDSVTSNEPTVFFENPLSVVVILNIAAPLSFIVCSRPVSSFESAPANVVEFNAAKI